MRILTENLASALYEAIQARAEAEKEECGPDFKSGLRAGWEEVLEALMRGENIYVADE